MSVSLLIQNTRDKEKNLYFPISGQLTYKEEWIPLAERLNLIFIPLFLTGIPISKDNLESVIKEFELLMNYTEQIQKDNAMYKYIYTKCGQVIEILNSFNPDSEELFIG